MVTYCILAGLYLVACGLDARKSQELMGGATSTYTIYGIGTALGMALFVFNPWIRVALTAGNIGAMLWSRKQDRRVERESQAFDARMAKIDEAWEQSRKIMDEYLTRAR
jgi:hypothetical protein